MCIIKKNAKHFASRPSLGAPAVRPSPSAHSQTAYNTVYRPTFGAPAGQPSPCAGIPALLSTLLTMPRQLPSSTKLSPAPQHFASRQAPPIPRRLRAEPKINGCLSDASLDKPRFALKAQVFAGSSASATTLACASLLANFARVLQKALCSLSLAKPFFPVTLAGAVLRERNAPTAATSARAYGTTSCSDLRTAYRNGECHFRSLGRSAQHSYSSLLHGATISPS